VIERRFDLNGARLALAADDEALAALVAGQLAGLEAEGGAPAAFVIRLKRGEPEPAPADAALLFDGRLIEGYRCVVRRAGAGEHWIVEDRVSMRLDAGGATISVPARAEAFARSSATIRALDMALAGAGQTLVHSASLSLPGNNRAVLLFGPSGVGKTTTTLALLAGGFGLMADDSSVLRMSSGTVEAWGLSRALKVHKRTFALLPWLQRFDTGAWSGEDEQAIRPERLAEVAALLPPRPLPVAALIAIGPRSDGAHRIAALPRTEMLVRLAADNVWRTRAGVLSDNLVRMERIAKAVATLPALELNAGTDLAALPATILAGIT
jgi:ABC-type branched-subunit amino acid transport system ATPase component